jgi:signal transduction histidine kinase
MARSSHGETIVMTAGTEGIPIFMNMTPTKTPAPAHALRCRAEKQVETRSAAVRPPRNEAELQRLVHELEVHQVELELQNAELHQTRAELETTLEQYTDLYDFAPVGYLTLDRSGTILAANLTAASLLEVDRANLTGRPFKRFVGLDAYPVWDALLRTVFTSRNTESAEFSAWTASNHPQHLQLEALAAPSGESCRVAIIDVSERQYLKQHLEDLHADLVERSAKLATANIDLEAFNYTVSHDLLNPLSNIHSYCELLLQMPGNELDEKPRKFIQAMFECSQGMYRLITSLLRFSCSSQTPLSRDFLDLSKMARVVAKDLQQSHPELRIRFRTAGGIMGNGDPDLCRIILDNLIGNAWKHSGMQTRAIIEFDAKTVSGKRIYFVRDNGPGFDMAMADNLFIPFQRLSGTSVEGYGIGLATVERIVSRHGGRIWAESEPGKGATFFFTLE